MSLYTADVLPDEPTHETERVAFAVHGHVVGHAVVVHVYVMVLGLVGDEETQLPAEHVPPCAEHTVPSGRARLKLHAVDEHKPAPLHD